ncbi:MAG: AraC family transcriptional regulator [Fimbriimonadaceae bacterium]|nr:helix-turn-helix transcriptional regulator [Chthonomonadaceae bacterium]MCO5296565.1 AraC family transcriptional regulator [Fimbriimonadaceae bacterium]
MSNERHLPCAAALGASRVGAARHATRVDLWRCIEQARAELAERAGEGVSLRTLSHAAGLSPWHFQRVFKRACGETPHAALRRMRLEAAHRLLSETGCSVTEACFAVGFSSVGSFCRLFRRSYGRSPGSVRKSQPRTTA